MWIQERVPTPNILNVPGEASRSRFGGRGGIEQNAYCLTIFALLNGWSGWAGDTKVVLSEGSCPALYSEDLPITKLGCSFFFFQLCCNQN